MKLVLTAFALFIALLTYFQTPRAEEIEDPFTDSSDDSACYSGSDAGTIEVPIIEDTPDTEPPDVKVLTLD